MIHRLQNMVPKPSKKNKRLNKKDLESEIKARLSPESAEDWNKALNSTDSPFFLKIWNLITQAEATRRYFLEKLYDWRDFIAKELQKEEEQRFKDKISLRELADKRQYVVYEQGMKKIIHDELEKIDLRELKKLLVQLPAHIASLKNKSVNIRAAITAYTAQQVVVQGAVQTAVQARAQNVGNFLLAHPTGFVSVTGEPINFSGEMVDAVVNHQRSRSHTNVLDKNEGLAEFVYSMPAEDGKKHLDETSKLVDMMYIIELANGHITPSFIKGNREFLDLIYKVCYSDEDVSNKMAEYIELGQAKRQKGHELIENDSQINLYEHLFHEARKKYLALGGEARIVRRGGLE